jgi:hypothetical protein
MLTLPRAGFVYDVRRGTSLGRHDRLAVDLEADRPTILAVSDAPLPAPTISLPARLRAGEIAALRVGRADATGPLQIFHVDLVDPSGNPAAEYAANLLAPHGTATIEIPFALNDPIGSWTVRVTDRLSGQIATAPIEIVAR